MKTWLLQKIHLSLKHLIEQGEVDWNAWEPIPEEIQTLDMGIFITLTNDGTICGCFGSPFIENSFLDTLKTLLVPSFLIDPRFPPLTPSMADTLSVELSLLTPPGPIDESEIQIGKHGLILMENENKALFLPKAAIKNQWGKELFLDKLCKKAELPERSWEQGATLLGFETIEIF